MTPTLRLPRTKRADGVGSAPDSSFERAFAEMAYGILQDRSPRLVEDYLQGFQLLDRNEDKTKAVGVFGILVGKQWMFVPAFFLAGGNLKGLELLWLKGPNQFVPNMEKWVNHLIGRSPTLLGREAPGDVYSRGGRAPSLWRLLRPPSMGASKMGAAADAPAPTRRDKRSFDVTSTHVAEWAKPFYALHAKHARAFAFAEHRKKIAAAVDLSEVLRDSPDARGAATLLCLRFPLLKAGFDRFYPGVVETAGVDEALLAERLSQRALVKEAASCCAGKKVKPFTSLARKKAALTWYTSKPDDATEAELTKLAHDGIVFRDKRAAEDLSKLINVHTMLNVSNPDTSGVFQVLCGDAKFRKAYVSRNPVGSSSGSGDNVLILPIDEKSKFTPAYEPMCNVWVSQDGGDAATGKDTKAWFEDLSSDSPVEDDTYVLVTKDGTVSKPFEIRRKLDEDTYEVSWRWMSGRNGKWRDKRRVDRDLKQVHYPSDSYGECCFGDGDVDTVKRNWKNVAVITVLGDTLLAPEDAKLVRVEKGWRPSMSPSEQPSAKRLPVGSIDDVRLVVEQMTQMFKVFNAGGGEYVVKAGSSAFRGTGTQALVHLVAGCGLTAEQGTALLKTATAPGSRPEGYRIKLADNYAQLLGGIAPQFPPEYRGAEQAGPYRSYDSLEFQEENVPIDGYVEHRDLTSIYDPFKQMEHMPPGQGGPVADAQEAQQNGDKEFFDVSMLKSMLSIVRQDDLIDKRIGKLMAAINEYGTILYLLYWHSDKFADRFGKNDLDQLENTIRNAFETGGDATLYLKEKSVNTGEGLPGFSSTGEPTINESSES